MLRAPNLNGTALPVLCVEPQRDERSQQKRTVEMPDMYIYIYINLYDDDCTLCTQILYYYTPRVVALRGGGEGPTDRLTLTHWPSVRTGDKLARAEPRVYICIYIYILQYIQERYAKGFATRNKWRVYICIYTHRGRRRPDIGSPPPPQPRESGATLLLS